MPAMIGIELSTASTKASMVATCSDWVKNVPSPAWPNTTKLFTPSMPASQPPSRLIAS
jgi:hypothetical protein